MMIMISESGDQQGNHYHDNDYYDNVPESGDQDTYCHDVIMIMIPVAGDRQGTILRMIMISGPVDQEGTHYHDDDDDVDDS